MHKEERGKNYVLEGKKKGKKEVLFVRIILKGLSRSAVSFEVSGATDWRAGGRSTVRQACCEQDGTVRSVMGNMGCETEFDCEILMGFLCFALWKFRSQNSKQNYRCYSFRNNSYF